MYLTLWSANHTFIRVINTPTVPYNTSLVWYAHLIFTLKASSWKYIMLASVISSAVTVQRRHLCIQSDSFIQNTYSYINVLVYPVL